MLQNQQINGSHDHIPYPTTTLQNLDEYQNGKTTVYLNKQSQQNIDRRATTTTKIEINDALFYDAF